MSEKQDKVIGLLKLGVSAAEVAAELGCSVKLAKSYCATAYDLLKKQGYDFAQSDSVEFIEQYRWLARECAREVEKHIPARREELATDCLADAVQAWDTFRGDNDATRKTWLRSIFKSTCGTYVAKLGRKLVTGYSTAALDLMASAPTRTTPSESETKDAELGEVVGYVQPSLALGREQDEDDDVDGSSKDSDSYTSRYVSLSVGDNDNGKVRQVGIEHSEEQRLSDFDLDVQSGEELDEESQERRWVWQSPSQAQIDEHVATRNLPSSSVPAVDWPTSPSKPWTPWIVPSSILALPARSSAGMFGSAMFHPAGRCIGPREPSWQPAPVALFSTLRDWKSSNDRASAELTARITRRRKRRSRSQVFIWPLQHYNNADPLDLLIDEEKLSEHEARRAEREGRKAKPKPPKPRKRGRQSVYPRSELAKMCGAWLASGMKKGAWSNRETGQQLANSRAVQILRSFPGLERRLDDTDGTVLQAHLKRAGKLYDNDAAFRADADAWRQLFEIHASWQREKKSA